MRFHDSARLVPVRRFALFVSAVLRRCGRLRILHPPIAAASAGEDGECYGVTRHLFDSVLVGRGGGQVIENLYQVVIAFLFDACEIQSGFIEYFRQGNCVRCVSNALTRLKAMCPSYGGQHAVVINHNWGADPARGFERSGNCGNLGFVPDFVACFKTACDLVCHESKYVPMGIYMSTGKMKIIS